MTALMEHHFDNHEFCNPSWCHFQEDSIRKSPDDIRGKLRNILSNPANKIVYDEVKIHDSFITHENLLMLMHPFDLQKNKALNCGFAKHAPKNIVFSKTFSLFDCLAFVIIIDSLGYEGTFKRLLADLFNKHDNAPDDVQLGWAQREDTFKMYILEQQCTKKEKIHQTAEKKLKLKAQREENMLARRKGDFYGRGLALQSDMVEDVVAGTNATVPTSKGAKRSTPTNAG